MMGLIYNSWIPIGIGLVLLYFAFRFLVLKNTGVVRSKTKPEPRDKEGYCRAGGKILAFFGAGILISGLIETRYPVASLVVVVIVTFTTIFLWKRMNDKYE